MGLENSFYFIYELFSEADKKHYTGYTHNLNFSFEQHIKNEVTSVTYSRPLKLVYFEACLNQQDATSREKILVIAPLLTRLEKRITGWL